MYSTSSSPEELIIKLNSTLVSFPFRSVISDLYLFGDPKFSYEVYVFLLTLRQLSRVLPTIILGP